MRLKQLCLLAVVILLVGCADLFESPVTNRLPKPPLPHPPAWDMPTIGQTPVTQTVTDSPIVEEFRKYCKQELGTDGQSHVEFAVDHNKEMLNDVDQYSTLASQLSNISSAQIGNNGNVLENIKTLKNYYLSVASNNSSIWNRAIDNHLEYNLLLGFFQKRCYKLGANDNSEKMYRQIQSRIVSLAEAQYSHTYKLYAVLSQMKDAAENPHGSLMTYNQTVNGYESEFEKELSLAELEFAKRQ